MNDNGKAISEAALSARMIKNLSDALPIREHAPTWPEDRPVYRKALAIEDVCPDCGGDLNIGWECTKCGADHCDLVWS